MRSESSTWSAVGAATTSCMRPRAAFTSRGALRSKVLEAVARLPHPARASARKIAANPETACDDLQPSNTDDLLLTFVIRDIGLRTEDQLLWIALQAVQRALDVAQRLLGVHRQRLIIAQARPSEFIEVLRK